MNGSTLRIPTPGAGHLRPPGSTPLEGARRSIAVLLMWLMIPLGVPPMAAFGQEAPPPPDESQGPPPEDQGAPPQQWNALTPEQLGQLVAPIALYPDSLVAQVLAASTYPTQVVDADRFVQSNAGAPPDQIAQMANSQPWDPSVKALTAFPSVLANMDRNLDWTAQLGNAYYNQPQDVMNAVQEMRQQAYQSGQLRSTPQLDVAYQPGNIVIAPPNPALVYVPYYNPWAVWGFHPYYAWYAPPPPRGVVFGVGLGLGFGIGVAVGAWSHWGWGWGHWGFGWGPHPYVAFNRVTYVSRSVTVINHGYYGRFDRGPGAREFNMRAAATARATGYNRGYAAGARNGYSRGAANGFNHGYTRGEANGYNRGYNRGQVSGFNRGAANNNPRAAASNGRPAPNFNRGVQNYNRPAQNYSRPAQNYNRSARNYNRPAQNYNHSGQRPQSNQRPHNQGHSSGQNRSHADHGHGH